MTDFGAVLHHAECPVLYPFIEDADKTTCVKCWNYNHPYNIPKGEEERPTLRELPEGQKENDEN